MKQHQNLFPVDETKGTETPFRTNQQSKSILLLAVAYK
jgi:hypothetical protein